MESKKYTSKTFKIAYLSHIQCCNPLYDILFKEGKLSSYQMLQEWYKYSKLDKFDAHRKVVDNH